MGRWPVIGRDRELHTLEDLLRDGTHVGVCLRGAAGVGKTRLAREFTEALPDESARTAWLSGHIGLGGVPFGALASWLDDISKPIDDNLLPVRIRQRLLGDGSEQLVVALDDVALIDNASVGLLADIAGSEQAWLILTSRDSQALPRDLQRMIDQGQIAEMSLEPLTYRDVQELLEKVLDGPVEEYTLRRLFDLSGGNPLLLRELVIGGLQYDVLSKQGQIWRLTAAIVDRRTPELIKQRLDALTEPMTEALAALALADSLPLSMMEQEFGSDVMSDLESTGLVEIQRQGLRHSARLTHPLYQEAIRANMTVTDTRLTYRRLLTAMKRTGERRNEDIVRLARWQVATGEIEDPDTLLSAARLAFASNDHALALDLANGALSTAPTFAARLLKGRALSGLGRWQEAEAELAELEPRDQVEITRQAVARAENLALQGGRRRALTILEDTLDATSDEELRNELEATIMFIASYLGDLERAIHESNRLLEGSEVNASTQVRILVIRTYSKALMGRFDQMVDHEIEEALQEAAKRPDHFPIAIDLLWVNRAVGLGSIGKLQDAEEIARTRYGNALNGGSSGPRGLWANNLGYALLGRGQALRARRFFLEAVAAFEEQDPVGSMFHALCLGAIAAAIVGDRRTTDDLIRQHEEHLAVRAQAFGSVLQTRALTWQQYAHGDLKAAGEAALAAGQNAVQGGQYIHAMAAFHDAVRFGYAHLVVDHLADLEAKVNGRLITAMSSHAKASVDNDPDDLMDVADEFARMGADLQAAETLAQACHIYGELGRAGSATQASVRAIKLLEQCGDATTPWLWLERPDGLTPRQLEVARLAAAGLTDREISDRLGISVRTVSNHLAAAFVKLGIHDRVELKGLVAPIS